MSMPPPLDWQDADTLGDDSKDLVSVPVEDPPSRELLRSAVSAFLVQHAGGRELTAGQLEALIDSLLRARTAYEELANLEDVPANAARIAALRDEASQAAEASREIAGLGEGFDGFLGRDVAGAR